MISAQLVKELREKTSAGMMDCKKALEETQGNLEQAIDWLRQKGLSKAAKKAGRTTSEGLIGCEVFDNGTKAVMVAVGCETDFVARGDNFVAFVAQTLKTFKASGKSELAEDDIRDSLNEAIATLGENITLGKSCRIELATSGTIGQYVHSNGKIAVLVELNCANASSATQPAFAELAKNVAMQIAAASPLAVSPEEIDKDLLEREREVYRQKAREEGKPEQIVEKIAEGAIKKYFKETCLLEQAYIRDDKITVGDLLKQCGKELGDTLSIKHFVRAQLSAE